MSDRIIEEALSIMGEHTCKEIVDGVWEHTFTPKRTLDLSELIYSQPTTTAGVLNEVDINAIIDQMFANARSDPEMLYVSRQTHHLCMLAVARGKRNHRAWLRRKRQRRAAQRRHYRGLR